MSDDAIRKRRRKHTIGIQITVFTWMLELLYNISTVARYFIWEKAPDNEWSDRMFSVFECFISFILIPGSYLLNNEAVKLLILEKGWQTFSLETIARYFQPKGSSSKVLPLGDCKHCQQPLEQYHDIFGCQPFREYPAYSVFS